MPKKNKVTTVTGEQAEPEDVVMGLEGFVKAEQAETMEVMPVLTCRHISKHHYNAKGRLEDIACDLPKGHAGDHHARYFKNVDNPETDARGIVISHHYHEEEADAWWGDMAGIPVRDIKEGKMPQLSNFQKDILADIMMHDESLSVEDALALAKASPKWMAANG